MKPKIEVPADRIETEAEDHAEETRYAVSHHGEELHPDQRKNPETGKTKDRPEPPWQLG